MNDALQLRFVFCTIKPSHLVESTTPSIRAKRPGFLAGFSEGDAAPVWSDDALHHLCVGVEWDRVITHACEPLLSQLNSTSVQNRDTKQNRTHLVKPHLPPLCH